jgi:hypothetical protein
MASIQNKYRYSLTDRTGSTFVVPLGEDKVTLSWERQDDNIADFEAKLNGKLTFTDEAFQRLLSLEQTVYRCSQVTISVDRQNCFGNWERLFSGTINMNKSDWNLDDCTVDITIDSYDAYNCLEIGLDEEVNVFQGVSNRYEAALIDSRIVIETKTCFQHSCENLYLLCGSETEEVGKWTLTDYIFHREQSTDQCTSNSSWARETLTVPSSEVVDSSWTPYSVASGNTKYIRPARIINVVYTSPSDYGDGNYTMTSDIIGAEGSPVRRIPNGMFLGDVLQYFVSIGCPDYKVVSNFFDINADPKPGTTPTFSENVTIVVNQTENKIITIQNSVSNTYIKPGVVLWFNNTYYRVITAQYSLVSNSPVRYNITVTLSAQPPTGIYTTTYRVYNQQNSVNYVTGQTSTTSGVLVFQKSDVKRPNAPNRATKMEISGKDFIEQLTEIFNLEYKAEAGIFRIEHTSLFQKPTGINATTGENRKYTQRFRKYSYDSDKLPGKEVYTFMENGYPDFVGFPITYNSDCVSREAKTQKIEHAVADITTDIETIMRNPDPDSKVISDDGIVLISAMRPAAGGQWLVNSLPGIFDSARLNNPFGWALLHRDYHKHKRPFRNGIMNQQETRFLSVVPTKKGETISVPMCCDLKFDPYATVTTDLGTGVVDKATYDFKSKMIDLELKYVADDGLITNAPPVAKSFSAFTFINTAAYIPFIGAFTDADGDTVTPVLNPNILPTHGTATLVTYNGQPNYLYYVPTAGYSGTDFIYFYGIDEFGEASNAAVITMTIRPANQSPTAATDVYFVEMNQAKSVPANQGLLVNDTDDYTPVGNLAVISATNPSHGTAVVQRDGSFVYTPAANYIGADSFTYTLQDGAGLTATGIVNITVRNLLGPQLNDDSYTMNKAALTFIGSGLGVLNNDTQGNGLKIYSANNTYPVIYTTTQGYRIEMEYDGSFRYIRPNTFAGVDTFRYTATNNNNSTNSANVTIHVNAMVYARFIESDLVTSPYQVIACPQGGQRRIRQTTADYTIYFYSDSAGTQPVNVGNMGLVANFIGTNTTQEGNSSSYGFSQTVPPAATTSYKIFEDLVLQYTDTGCTTIDGTNPGESYWYSVEMVNSDSITLIP